MNQTQKTKQNQKKNHKNDLGLGLFQECRGDFGSFFGKPSFEKREDTTWIMILGTVVIFCTSPAGVAK